MSAAPRPTRFTPLLVGHRGHRLARIRRPRRDGAARREMENTLPAFDRAVAAGCDGLELDIHRTRDAHLVVTHDPILQGCTIAASRLAELRRLQPSLPTLAQVLRRYRAHCWLDVEVKAPQCEVLLVRALRALPPKRGYVLSAFEPAILQSLARHAPGLPLCLNLKRPASLRRLQALPLVAVAPHVRLARRGYLQRLHRAGLLTVVWTVNRPARMRALARAGVTAIVSDNPPLLVETIRAWSAARLTPGRSAALMPEPAGPAKPRPAP